MSETAGCPSNVCAIVVSVGDEIGSSGRRMSCCLSCPSRSSRQAAGSVHHREPIRTLQQQGCCPQAAPRPVRTQSQPPPSRESRGTRHTLGRQCGSLASDPQAAHDKGPPCLTQAPALYSSALSTLPLQKKFPINTSTNTTLSPPTQSALTSALHSLPGV